MEQDSKDTLNKEEVCDGETGSPEASLSQPVDVEPEKQHFTDEDILRFATNLMSKAVERSRQKNFATVGFTFTDLQLLSTVASAALDRTIKLNKLLKSLKERDAHLAKQLKEFNILLKSTSQNVSDLETGYNQILSTVTFFVDRIVNEKDKGSN